MVDEPSVICESGSGERRFRLDRYLEPPRCAVLTWLILGQISLAVIYVGEMYDVFNKTIFFITDAVNRMLAMKVPSGLRTAIAIGHILPLLVWYQPVVFRLSLTRGIIWIGCAGLVSLASIWVQQIVGHSPTAVLISAWMMCSGILLTGCRNRPWLSFPAGALSLVVEWLLIGLPSDSMESYFWKFLIMNLPYAVIMLYGTRPIRGESTA